MYMEEAIATISKKVERIEDSIGKLEQALKSDNGSHVPEYLTIQQIDELADWPFSGSATRKLISRRNLLEGVHYHKINGRIILRWSALKGLLDGHFAIR